MYNKKSVFLAALLIFELGSIICAAASTSPIFIWGRATAGAGGAGIMSGALSIGTNLVPHSKKPLYIAIVSSMFGVASGVGPPLGGVFTDTEQLTWRFCFWVNLRKYRLVSLRSKLTVCSIRCYCFYDRSMVLQTT